MIYQYWIDRKGGSHYHKEDCPMVKDTNYHYESIKRTKPREKDRDWILTRIREGGRYFSPCACIFGTQRQSIFRTQRKK